MSGTILQFIITPAYPLIRNTVLTFRHCTLYSVHLYSLVYTKQCLLHTPKEFGPLPPSIPLVVVLKGHCTFSHPKTVSKVEKFNRNIKTCGMCGGNFGRNHYRSKMLSHSEAYSMVESSRLDYYQQCAPSYLQVQSLPGRHVL